MAGIPQREHPKGTQTEQERRMGPEFGFEASSGDGRNSDNCTIEKRERKREQVKER